MAATLVIYPGVVERLAASERVMQALERRAQRGLAAARQIAPVRTGRYVGSFRIVRVVKGGRLIVRLENTAPYAAYLEYGTRYVRRQRILGRAMDAMR